MDTSPWLFPEIEYSCLRCGQSCGQWRIWVEPEKIEGIRQHPLSLELAVLGQSPLHTSEEGSHLVHRQDGKCHFLASDALCELHRDLGWESKPRPCRQFPFFLYETPEGIQIGLSFRCTAVKQAHGEDWSQHLETLEDLRNSGTYPRIGFEPETFGTLRLDWQTYQQWEKRWQDQLHRLPLWQVCRPELEAHLPYFWPEPLLDRQLARLAAASLGFLNGMSWEQLDPFALEQAHQFSACHQPQHVRYLRHVLERKTLWWGESVLSQLVMTLVGERLLHYFSQHQGLEQALNRVEGEWLAHRHDLGPLSGAFAQVLLHPPVS